MYKAARDVHTNGIHNTFTSKGRGKMNHIKQFFREKGLYLFCLAMVFAATAAGILALLVNFFVVLRKGERQMVLEKVRSRLVKH